MRLSATLFLCAVLLPVPAANGQPNLFAGAEDFARMNELAGHASWASGARAAILRTADAWPQSHLDRFGLKELAIPAEGGQWYHHYVCPTHGVRLQFAAPSTHRCPTDGKTYSGWPYDQVTLSDQHDNMANTARDLGLAYQLTGDPDYARRAAWILNEYASRYSSFRLHDTNDRQTRSAGRVLSQTLDESIWLLSIAWAYDLIRDSGVLSEEARARIDRDLIRAAAGTIMNNDAGKSNWQSWHNAALAAAGFLLDDAELIDRAIDGRSGFRFQMRESVVDGGFWYEGAWGYHFYALDALTRTAEMARRRNIDLWSSEPALASLFSNPLKLMFADGSMPLFNDTGAVNLFTQDGLYEIAYARTGDPALLGVLNRRTRGRNALLFGVETLDPAAAPPLASTAFAGAGFAVLRPAGTDHTYIMKFGPHGGGHGHYDKLGFVSYFNGGVLGVDPGTQSYAAPTHKTWDLMSVAHNTIVVNEQRQNEATGALLWFQQGDGYAAAAASAGAAYSNVALTRTLFVTADYTIDLSEAQSVDGGERTFDWIYHNGGKVNTALPLEQWNGFGTANGYQHLSGNRGARTGEDWRADFDGSPVTLPSAGSVYASNGNVKASFAVSAEQAYEGRYSARAYYEFTGAGYALYTVTAANVPQGKPGGLRVWIFGDGSGHKLSLRLTDATDERFVASIGPVDWKGWKAIEVRDPESWTHFLGNNDGVFDAPLRSAILQLDFASGGPSAGALFLDQPEVLTEDSTILITGFEQPQRNLALRMLGGVETDVVTGSGLGPDLRVPVPYVLARRRGSAARFVTLLEPYLLEPVITGFADDGAGCLLVRAAGWRDSVCVGPAGVNYRRE